MRTQRNRNPALIVLDAKAGLFISPSLIIDKLSLCWNAAVKDRVIEEPLTSEQLKAPSEIKHIQMLQDIAQHTMFQLGVATRSSLGVTAISRQFYRTTPATVEKALKRVSYRLSMGDQFAIYFLQELGSKLECPPPLRACLFTLSRPE